MNSATSLLTALANVFAFYFKAHSYHWNVSGMNFPELHSFFGTIYTDVWESVDGLAEHLRALDEIAPTNPVALLNQSGIQLDAGRPSAQSMVKMLFMDNEIVLQSLLAANAAAESEGIAGLANYLQSRIDTHSKYHWMLSATQS